MQPDIEVVWNGSVRPVEPFIRDAALAPLPDMTFAARSALVAKTCPSCGDTFFVKQSSVRRRRYCSKRCRQVKVEKTCPQCEKPFIVSAKRRDQVHCSQYCQGRQAAKRRTSSAYVAMGRLGGLKSGIARRQAAAGQSR